MQKRQLKYIFPCLLNINYPSILLFNLSNRKYFLGKTLTQFSQSLKGNMYNLYIYCHYYILDQISTFNMCVSLSMPYFRSSMSIEWCSVSCGSYLFLMNNRVYQSVNPRKWPEYELEWSHGNYTIQGYLKILKESQLLIHMEIQILKRAVADPSAQIGFVHKTHLMDFIVHTLVK